MLGTLRVQLHQQSPCISVKYNVTAVLKIAFLTLDIISRLYIWGHHLGCFQGCRRGTPNIVKGHLGTLNDLGVQLLRLSMCDPPGCPGNLPAKADVPGKKLLGLSWGHSRYEMV